MAVRTGALLLMGLAACSGPKADLVLVNGRVITVDSADRVAEAVAIAGNRIAAVGTREAIMRWVGPATEVIDLGGKAVTPGLLDGHAHFAMGAVDRRFVADLSYPNVKSVAEIVAKVAAEVAKHRAGEWVVGRGWDEGKLAELRYVTAADLDRVAPDNPVWLTHTMGHYGTANSAALRLAGVGKATPDPAGGTIDKLPNGAPSGVLKESAQELVTRLVPDYTVEQTQEAIADLARAFNAEGMTGLKDPGISDAMWTAYRGALADSQLTVRVFALWRPEPTPAAARALLDRVGATTARGAAPGDDRLISGGVKLFIDGSGGARTAWVNRPWNRNRSEVDGGNTGYPASDPDTLGVVLRMFHDAGWHISVHSIGDRAIDWTVDQYLAAFAANPKPGLRHGIIHANIPSDRALDGIARLQRDFDAGYPEPSSGFLWWIGDTYAGNFGPERSLRLNPFKTYLDRGIRWANGSDYNVTPFPARYGIWASVARETLLGVYGAHPWGMAEAIDVRTALRAQTIWVARQMFLENEIGSIEVGKYADLAVWDRDLLSVETAALRDLTCELTIFNGKVVYRRGDRTTGA
ncbi:MAG: amidohydrolase family protein [Gemmatimonadetes bacterium]|nr:amidohydrolase family protein [Gemmatimonadota bacterium]